MQAKITQAGLVMYFDDSKHECPIDITQLIYGLAALYEQRDWSAATDWFLMRLYPCRPVMPDPHEAWARLRP